MLLGKWVVFAIQLLTRFRGKNESNFEKRIHEAPHFLRNVRPFTGMPHPFYGTILLYSVVLTFYGEIQKEGQNVLSFTVIFNNFTP